MYEIWTRDFETPNKLDCMLGGFKSMLEAMDWLVNTYTADARFWESLKEIKIIYNGR